MGGGGRDYKLWLANDLIQPRNVRGEGEYGRVSILYNLSGIVNKRRSKLHRVTREKKQASETEKKSDAAQKQLGFPGVS